MHNYKAVKIISALKALDKKSKDEIVSILNDKNIRTQILDALYNLKPQLSDTDVALIPGVKMSTYDTHGLISSHPTNKSGLDSLEEKCSSKKYSSKIVPNIICTKDSGNNPFGSSDYYMTIFEGFLYIPKAGDYDIAIDGDDAVDFTCNGNIVGWYGGHGWCKCTSHHKVFHFDKPGYYKFKFRQEEMTGGDNWRLLWKKPGDSNFEVIPPKYFFHSDDADGDIYEENYWPMRTISVKSHKNKIGFLVKDIKNPDAGSLAMKKVFENIDFAGAYTDKIIFIDENYINTHGLSDFYFLFIVGVGTRNSYPANTALANKIKSAIHDDGLVCFFTDRGLAHRVFIDMGIARYSYGFNMSSKKVYLMTSVTDYEVNNVGKFSTLFSGVEMCPDIKNSGINIWSGKAPCEAIRSNDSLKTYYLESMVYSIPFKVVGYGFRETYNYYWTSPESMISAANYGKGALIRLFWYLSDDYSHFGEAFYVFAKNLINIISDQLVIEDIEFKNIFSYDILKFLYENYKQELLPLFKSKFFWQNIKKFGDNKVLDFIDEKDLCLNKQSVLYGTLCKTNAVNTVKDYNNIDEMSVVDKETVLQGLNSDKKIIVSTDVSKTTVAPWAIDTQNLDYENMTLDEIFWLYFPEHKGKVWNHILSSVSKYEFMSRIKDGKLVKYLSLKYGLKDVFLNKKILTPKYDGIFYGSYPVISSFAETKELYDEKWEHNSYAVWNSEDEIKLTARPPYRGRLKGECHYEFKKIKTFEADVYLHYCGHLYIYVNDELKYNKTGPNYWTVSNMGKVSLDINDKATIKIVLDTRCWYDYATGYLKNIKVTYF